MRCIYKCMVSILHNSTRIELNIESLQTIILNIMSVSNPFFKCVTLQWM